MLAIHPVLTEVEGETVSCSSHSKPEERFGILPRMEVELNLFFSEAATCTPNDTLFSLAKRTNYLLPD